MYEVSFQPEPFAGVASLKISIENETVTGIDWQHGPALAGSPSSPLARQVCRQLEEYFSGQRRSFDFPQLASGTEFQKKIWQLLREIPYGQTITYSQLAQKAGNARASRAVAQACKKNPLSVVVPCHRVVGSQGPGGYNGNARADLLLKQKLLALEGLSL